MATATSASRPSNAASTEGDEPRLLLQILDREPDREPIDGPPDKLFGGRLNTGEVEYVAQRHAQPFGVSDQSSTDLVGYTGNRDVSLHHVEPEEVVVRQLDLPIHHPCDPHRPGGGIDAWRDEGGVDPVEVAGRGHQRRDPVHVERHRRAWRRYRGDGFGKPNPASICDRLGRGLREVPPDEPGEQREQERRTGADEEGPPTVVDVGCGGSTARRPQRREREDPDSGSGGPGRERRHQFTVCGTSGGEGTEQPEPEEGHRRTPAVRPRSHPGSDGETDQDDADAEGELVRRSEQ